MDENWDDVRRAASEREARDAWKAKWGGLVAVLGPLAYGIAVGVAVFLYAQAVRP